VPDCPQGKVVLTCSSENNHRHQFKCRYIRHDQHP